MDQELKTYLDSLQTQLSSMEQRIATKDDLQALEQRTGAMVETVEHRMTTSLDALGRRMATSLDALGRRMATDLENAVDRLDESIKSRKEDENALYRIVEDHEERIGRLEQKAL